MSTLKVSNIQDISNNAAMSISGGVTTFNNFPSGIITSGTYTPQLFDAVTGGNGGGAEAANGNYVKIGTFCHVSIRMINVTKSGLNINNTAYFSLPFTSANIISNYSTNMPQVAILQGTSSSETPPVLNIYPNTSRFFMSRIVDNSNPVEFTVNNVHTGFDITTSVTYITAS